MSGFKNSTLLRMPHKEDVFLQAMGFFKKISELPKTLDITL